ncbi:MAG: hypothetical protein ACK4TF_01420 [Thermodesulfovibrionales bacterium]
MLRTVSILLFSMLLLYGCGGGGSEGSGGSASINITSFDMNPKTISAGTTFDVTWSVNYSAPSHSYWLEFHMNNQNSIPSDMSGLTNHFYRNCDVPGLDCGTSGTIRCEVVNLGGNLSTKCNILNSTVSPQSHGIIFTGDGYAILKACVHNSQMQEVCDQKSIQIKVQ